MSRILPCEDRRLLNQITWFMELQIYSISRKIEIKKILIICNVACLTIEFFLNFVPDTVCLAGELRYKYQV